MSTLTLQEQSVFDKVELGIVIRRSEVYCGRSQRQPQQMREQVRYALIMLLLEMLTSNRTVLTSKEAEEC